ncbi:MAG: cyclic nucleotide-binding domain-containing protein [Kosmotoga sp.]|nr:MAG: cyclic nucleotide-binding domain-containing protein [Kosmotoga sp.]
MNKIERIISNKLFKGIDKKVLQNEENMNFIRSIFNEKTYDKNEVIIEEGEKARNLFLINRGSVEVKKRVVSGHFVKINELFKKDFFREIGLIFPDKKRSALVFATEKVHLFKIKENNLNKLIKKFPEIESNMYINIKKIIKKSDFKTMNSQLKDKVIMDIYDEICNSKKKKKKPLRRFATKTNGSYLVIPEDDIYYFKSDMNYCFMYLYDCNYFYDLSLKKLEKVLDPNKFMRIHRKYIIACNKVRKIKKESPRNYFMVLKDEQNTRLKIGRTYLRDFKSRFLV